MQEETDIYVSKWIINFKRRPEKISKAILASHEAMCYISMAPLVRLPISPGMLMLYCIA